MSKKLYLVSAHRAVRALVVAAALASVCVASTVAAQKTQKPKRDAVARKHLNESLRRELLRMYEAEQAARKPMEDGVWADEAESRRIQAIDDANTKRLTEIVRRHGFPTVRLVGKDAVQAAFVIMIHSQSLALKKRALPYVRSAARRGEIPNDAFASLTDTILRAEGKPQVYGTKFDLVEGKRFVIAPTRDPARLDARRAALGLPPIAVYAKGLSEMYKMPVDANAPPR